MYSRSAAFYDAIYSFKNYAAEAAMIDSIIRARKLSSGNRLLDVACGTGRHIQELRARGYDADGVDLEENLLAIARARNPDARFHRADMTDFDLESTYDVVTCLFSAIGYVVTVERLRRTIANLARHLAPGGVILVEPWLSPEAPLDPLSQMSVDLPNLKVARIVATQTIGKRYVAYFHYLIGKPGGVDYLVERHELGLFTRDEYRDAFEAAGIEAALDPKGLIGRGMWIGIKRLG